MTLDEIIGRTIAKAEHIIDDVVDDETLKLTFTDDTTFEITSGNHYCLDQTGCEIRRGRLLAARALDHLLEIGGKPK